MKVCDISQIDYLITELPARDNKLLYRKVGWKCYEPFGSLRHYFPPSSSGVLQRMPNRIAASSVLGKTCASSEN